MDFTTLTKEQLLVLLQSKAPVAAAPIPPSKKPRKKIEQDEAKREAMLERLADMRAKVQANKEAKKEAAKKEDPVACFEKKYATNFEKMNELLTTLNENTSEVAKLKREKKADREAEKEAKAKAAAEIKAIQAPPPPAPPAQNINLVVAPSVQQSIAQPQYPAYVPNPLYAPPALPPPKRMPTRDMFRQNKVQQW
tara:strand:- start:11 stop:595 length:585 start_codon:yes stop_codon:yes gene_type:complete